MADPPEFLSYPAFLNREERHRPAPPSRRGELIAWLCALGIGVAGLILVGRYGTAPCFTWQLLALFVVAGGLISLGNWLDLRTQIELSPEGISFQSPLRSIALDWGAVESLSATPLRGGWRLLVEGAQGRFALRTISQLRWGPVESQPMGFPEGERIGSLVRGMAGLPKPIREGARWVSRR